MNPESLREGTSMRKLRRRTFLGTSIRASVAAGMAGLPLPRILEAAARSREGWPGGPATAVPGAAVIQIWLGGGPTHFETYDPKPDAPAEYRGPFQSIPTKLPGVRICEVLPRHARILDRVVIRELV